MEKCKTSYFSNKGNYGNKVKSVENEKTLDIDTKVAEVLKSFFKTAVSSLNIHGNQWTVENVENMNDTVDKVLKYLSFIQVFHLSKIELAKTFFKTYFALMK